MQDPWFILFINMLWLVVILVFSYVKGKKTVLVDVDGLLSLKEEPDGSMRITFPDEITEGELSFWIQKEPVGYLLTDRGSFLGRMDLNRTQNKLLFARLRDKFKVTVSPHGCLEKVSMSRANLKKDCWDMIFSSIIIENFRN